jgi:hypothetical protein
MIKCNRKNEKGKITTPSEQLQNIMENSKK